MKLPRLTPEELAAAEPQMIARLRLRSGHKITATDSVHLVTSGTVLRLCGDDGDGVVTDIVGTGQGFVGPCVLRPVTDARIFVLPEEWDLESTRVLRDAQVRLDVLTIVRARPTALDRVLGLLDLIAGEDGVCPPVSQADVAALLAIRPETTSRAVGELRTTGRIEWPPHSAAKVIR